VKETFNAAHETERKRALSALLSQTKQQERKDAEILAEAKRIMETRAASKVSNQHI
jgi:DNA methyltransferase 1-associated protein 1